MVKERALDAITAISIKGFKSFAEEQRIEISPLTLLAGANSSGKSSALQPLLLLKQTLEEVYDPGPLQIFGPHAKFSSAQQLLARFPGGGSLEEFEISIALHKRSGFREIFRRTPEDRFDLVQMEQGLPGGKSLILEPGLSSQELEKRLPVLKGISDHQSAHWIVVRQRCFLGVVPEELGYPLLPSTSSFAQPLLSILHVPGLRGNPERSYNTSAVGELFPGTFENYVASIIAAWQKSSDERLSLLGQALQSLGLTWRIEANPLDATRVELLVARLPKRTKSARGDLVNIADVGFGVSQVLPVLVALLTAEPGQLVYIEQPELHLHPQAQQALAPILAEAAGRGVRVVAETHSSILLLAIQALVAEGKLSPDILKLHWFQRDSRGATRVTSADLDQNGAYGDWPVDFDRVEAAVGNRYLDAVEGKFFSAKKNAKG